MLGWVWHGLAWPGWAVIRQYTQAADPFILILISPLYRHLSYHCNLFICRFMQINLLLLFSVGFLNFFFFFCTDKMMIYNLLQIVHENDLHFIFHF